MGIEQYVDYALDGGFFQNGYEMPSISAVISNIVIRNLYKTGSTLLDIKYFYNIIIENWDIQDDSDITSDPFEILT